MAIDPVCGMEVSEQGIKREYQGRDYYFCSPGCVDEFDRNPERYVAGATETNPISGPQGQPGKAHAKGDMEPGVPRREKREKKFGT